jgi:outer membrane protein assembly factor BamB
MTTQSPKSILLAIAAISSFSLLSIPVQAGDWPQWRGENRDDISTETGLLKSWPKDGPKKVWINEEGGLGYAGFAVADGKLFTMGLIDGKCNLLAFDANSGKRLWSTAFGGHFKNKWGDGPRATPTVSDGHVYALAASGELLCAKASDGTKVWSKSLVKDFGGRVPGWGYCESVLVDGDQVVCTPGGSKGGGVMAALNKKTGKTIWTTKAFPDGAQYSSIVPIVHNGERQYVQLTQKALSGVRASDGKLLWQSDWTGRTAVIPTPVYSDGHVYIASGYGVGCKLVKIGDNSPTDVYVNKVMKNHHGGVIKVGDHLYGYSDGGGWLCQDFKSGEMVWNEKNALRKGAIACADGQFYLLEESTGTVALIDVSPKGWKEKGRFTLSPQTTQRSPSGKVWTHPVISNGKLYLRDQEIIYCFDIKS